MRQELSTVLVVDDDDTIRGMVVRILEQSGFSVDSARDGLEAIEKLLRGTYAVVVLDLMMPRVDGFGVIDFLRRRDNNELQSVIVLSSVRRRRIYDEPVYEVLEKPFDIQHLVDSAKACSERIH